MSRRPPKQRPAPRLWSWLALVALVLASWGVVQRGHARLRPYHVVEGQGLTDLRPRILFVLDTSGSMTEVASSTGGFCSFADCETAIDTTSESRISAARRVINNIVTANADQAKFSLMTFEQYTPHTGGTPAMCGSGTRFMYVTQYRWDWGGTWAPIDRGSGYNGVWKPCQGSARRPYPYLRWDDLGRGASVTANDQTGALPPSPMITVNEADYKSTDNADRGVQWFPQFMGVRWQPNDTTDPGRAITYASVGDYGGTAAVQDVEVWGHDFYYWPYVEGFPGYGAWGHSPANTAGEDSVGVVDETGGYGAHLYAPFYLDLSATAVPSSNYGPATEDEGRDAVLAHTSPLIEGGVDVGGSTPWRSVIGDAAVAPPSDNSTFSHSSVASYLNFLRSVETPDECAPTAVVLISDGLPSPASEGGAPLYSRLAALRNDLDVPVYVLGLFITADEINDMACAGAGACDGFSCDTPCDDAPADAWDTCADPANPGTACAYLAGSAGELQTKIAEIIDDVVEFDVQSGQGSTINDMTAGAGNVEEEEVLQTELFAYTKTPTWKGHVVRRYCDDRDASDVLLPHCTPPTPEFSAAEAQPTFGPCPQSRDWDAGECLRQTAWNDRRLYTHDSSNNVIAISNPDGTATAEFLTELTALGLAGNQAEADAIAAFVLGEQAPNGWKLPGLATSAPVVVRRIPEHKSNQVPEVAIRDPHCGGRFYPMLEAGALPDALEDLARDAWDEDDATWVLQSPQEHYAYQEMVLVGDDMGVLHAFQLDSGNELWGFVPRSLLTSLKAQSDIGWETVGQPDSLDDHIFGISATVNHTWVADPGPNGTLDDADDQWRHVAVFGFGAGGPEFVALDVTRTSPALDPPLQVLWTTEDASVKASYDQFNGETWARPAITYEVPLHDLANSPTSYLVLGSGYQTGTSVDPAQGRTLIYADVLTGAIQESVQLPDISHTIYEPDFGTVVDPVVATHCRSRFWAEVQETYIADPAGRLFRWDLGVEADHEADSEGGGAPGSGWGAIAVPVDVGGADHFPACTDTSSTCTVSSTNPGDVFIFPPAVSANDRIDDFADAQAGNPVVVTDQFLIALISGSTVEDTIEGLDPTNDFHSSLYLLVDDHSTAPKEGGFSIPAGAPKSVGTFSAGTDLSTGDAGYLRLALSDIERTRTVVPYEGATPVVETRNFSKATRPIRAPRIFVTGVAEQGTGTDPDTVIDDVEVYYAQFTVYEPPADVCNDAFYDSSTDTWYPDRGETYVITFRLTADTGSGFNFQTGTNSAGVDFGTGFNRGLTLTDVEQVDGGDDCPNGNCGGQPSASPGGGGNTPCNSQDELIDSWNQQFSVSTRNTQIPAFTPIE